MCSTNCGLLFRRDMHVFYSSLTYMDFFFCKVGQHKSVFQPFSWCDVFERRMLSCVQRIEKSASYQCADVYCSSHMAKVSLLMQNRNVFACFHVFVMENGPNERCVNVTNVCLFFV